MPSPKLELRVHPDLLARIDDAAQTAGLSRSTWVTVALAGAVLKAENGGPVFGALEHPPVEPAPARVRSAKTPTPADPGRAVLAAASVVAPRTSPRLAGSDPRAGCTHPPASVRTRGGIRACGNCGTDLGLAKGGDAKT